MVNGTKSDVTDIDLSARLRKGLVLWGTMFEEFKEFSFLCNQMFNCNHIWVKM